MTTTSAGPSCSIISIIFSLFVTWPPLKTVQREDCAHHADTKDNTVKHDLSDAQGSPP